MSAFTNIGENKILDLLFNAVDWNPVCYLGLFTAAPNETGGGTEVSTSGTAYARQAVASNFEIAGTTAAGECNNDTQIVFPTATADWGTITYGGLFDAASGGNLIMYAQLPSSKLIEAGDTFRYPVGGVKGEID